jgi:hypothetical protein
MLFNSSFVLIIHVPSLAFVGLNIIHSIFLSIISNFSAHVSLAYVITGL